MISLLILTLSSCATTPEVTPVEIPEFLNARPTRPTLVVIPNDSPSAIKALTTNMSKLVGHIESWEVYGEYLKNYYESVLELILNKHSNN
jgi:hypothetical protein